MMTKFICNSKSEEWGRSWLCTVHLGKCKEQVRYKDTREGQEGAVRRAGPGGGQVGPPRRGSPNNARGVGLMTTLLKLDWGSSLLKILKEMSKQLWQCLFEKVKVRSEGELGFAEWAGLNQRGKIKLHRAGCPAESHVSHRYDCFSGFQNS